MSFLLLTPFQIVLSSSDSMRMCSSSERTQYSSNSSGKVFVILSEIMVPLLTIGDVVAVEDDTTFNDLRIGDIIAFKEPVPVGEKAEVIINRINEKLTDPHYQIVLLTKGDANPSSIPWIDFSIYENSYVGRLSCLLEEGHLQDSSQSSFDWAQICSSLQIALLSSCDVLVNLDGTLTNEGERAVGCIRNGIVLAGGGSYLLNLPLPLIISALQILEESTGCGGIVQWRTIGSVGDLRSIINLLT